MCLTARLNSSVSPARLACSTTSPDTESVACHMTIPLYSSSMCHIGGSIKYFHYWITEVTSLLLHTLQPPSFGCQTTNSTKWPSYLFYFILRAWSQAETIRERQLEWMQLGSGSWSERSCVKQFICNLEQYWDRQRQSKGCVCNTVQLLKCRWYLLLSFF